MTAVLSGALLAAVLAPLPQRPPSPEPSSPYQRPGVWHAGCRGRVLGQDGAPLANAGVLVLGYQPYYGSVPLASARTGDDGRFELRDICGRGKLVPWVVSPPTAPFARRDCELTLVSGEVTELPAWRPFDDGWGIARHAGRVRGIVRAADGNAVRGAFVRLQGEEKAFDPSAFAFTDAEGRFDIPSATGVPDALAVFFSNRRLQIEHEAGRTDLARRGLAWKVDLAREVTVAPADTATCLLQVAGAAGEASYAIDVGGVWQSCDDRLAMMGKGGVATRAGWGRPPAAAGAGHLPRLAPVSGPATFDFGTSVPMRLSVRGGGEPLAGATVDVCLAGPRGARCLASLRTGAHGEIATAGDPNATYTVYAYARGYRAARALWRAGDAPAIDLQPETARLVVAPGPGRAVVVRPAGLFAPIAALYLRPGRPAEVDLVPGRYELTRYDDAGKVVAAIAVELAAGETRCAVAGDTRPTAVLTLPAVTGERDWWVTGRRSTAGGLVASWLASSGGGHAPVSREQPAAIEKVDGEAHRFRLRFPTSGRYTIWCGHRGLGYRLFRDVQAEFGAGIEVAPPALNATVVGRIASYPAHWQAMLQHGVAGPRLMLLPDRATQTRWGAMVAGADSPDLRLEKLPAGSYWLHHHLYTTGSSGHGTWGGQALRAKAGNTVDAGRLRRQRGRSLAVEVLDQSGEPLSGRLRVRDRMFESWRAVVGDGSTLGYAADPLPEPPACDVIDGHGELPDVRPGHLELVFSTAERAWYLEGVLEAEGKNRIQVHAR